MEQDNKPRRVTPFWPIYNPETGENRFEWILRQAEKLRNERRRSSEFRVRRFKEL